MVIFGDEGYLKSRALSEALNGLLPPDVDRSLALSEYDGTRGEGQGGPELAAVMDDLRTLPFLSDRRVVVIREADKFVTSHRDALEKYANAPAASSVLVLVCRSFPKTTRLYKAAAACGSRLVECKKLSARNLTDFVARECEARGKRVGRDVAARLVDLTGQDQGVLAGEVEKLCLYSGDRNAITAADVDALVGLSREEKVFAVMDVAASGRLADALELWHQVLSTDPGAVYKALGGMAFKARRWIAAQKMHASGSAVRAIAPKVMMWGREAELAALLKRLPLRRLKQLLAEIATLDAKAKSGVRSIETGVEALLIGLAA